MANPLVAQGSLNRVRASVSWPNFPELNITAPYLGADGIRLALEGESTVFLPTMTGAVTSPQPYMMISLTTNLIKTQALADAYKAQMESNALLGDGVVRPDVSSGLSPYPVTNCAIESVRELAFNGSDAGFVVTIKGYYLVNSSLFD
jgi:hypothetical protein